MRKILSLFGKKYLISGEYSGGGFGYIKRNIKGFCLASQGSPYFILTDLDKYQCPLDLIHDWLNIPIDRNCFFRIAVKEVEAWLLADKQGVSEYLGIPESVLPRVPEQDQDPKEVLMRIVRRSRKRRIKDDVLPINENAKIGPNYNGRLSEFVRDYWCVDRAMDNSTSLSRAYVRLRDFEYHT